VELATAVWFYMIVTSYSSTASTAKLLVFGSILIILFFTDLEKRSLPLSVTIPGLLTGLVFAPFAPVTPQWPAPTALPLPLQNELNALAAAAILAGPFYLVTRIYELLAKKEVSGRGDFILLAILGAFLGLQQGIVALFLGSVGGTIVGLGYILGSGQGLRTYRLPFGTFLCGAGLVAQLWGTRFFEIWWSLGS
jgi:leader peptidase (prepilin peptidase)/N-methyltransferase